VIGRVARWAWPVIFLIPLTVVAGRGCRFPGVDFTYHLVIWLHEHLPALYVAAAGSAAGAVAVRVGRVRARAATLFALATPLPPAVESAFAREADRLALALPRLAYLNVAAPVCFALVGTRPSVVVSRGFVEGMDADQLGMVARHELLHVKHGDPLRGFAWHLLFAALLMPAFSSLERWLSSRRELRTNLEAARADPERYAALLVARARERRGMCIEGFAAAERGRGLLPALTAPVTVIAILAALAFSHAWFLDHLAYLSTNHC
jgi:Zn-dependent protease with chaperone function